MKTYYDCLPCFVNQTLHAARLASEDKDIHELVLRKFLKAVSEMEFQKSPPLMGQFIHRIIRKYSASDDPYKNLKDQFNLYALSLYPELKKMIEQSSKKLETAVRLAIAGNIIDFGANTDIDQASANKSIESSLSQPLTGNIKHFCKSLQSAEKILYLGDNTGEIVFDRLLIEQLPSEKIIFAVRGRPVINDAVMSDAEDTKMTDAVKVIDNGTDVPGTVIEQCSNEFKQAFEQADLIISKGQGNYETLSDTNKNIFFLLKAKCRVIAKDIDCEQGSSVIAYK